MTRSQADAALLFCASLFAYSVLRLVLGIHHPGMGGDELWFATPLLNRGLFDLSPFQFVYSGASKTFVGGVVFEMFGFSVYTVRLISITAFALTIGLLAAFLRALEMPVAACVFLLLATFSFDLQFFAKVDINRPSFHNLAIAALFVCWYLLLLGKHRARIPLALAFLALSLFIVNGHLRHVWVTNSLAAVALLGWFAFEGRPPTRANLLRCLRERWPIFLGAALAVLYVVYVMVRFRDHPILAAGRALAERNTLVERLWSMPLDVARHSVGSRVFVDAFAPEAQAGFWDMTAGLVALVSAGAAILVLWRRRREPASDAMRLFLCVTAFLGLVILQYALTRSAIHPWHTNAIFLFTPFWVALLVEVARPVMARMAALVAAVAVAGTFVVGSAATLAMTYPRDGASGFQLAVFNLQSVAAVREFIRRNPGSYAVADWGIGRTLALEARYAPSDARTVRLREASFMAEDVEGLAGWRVIRSTPLTRTVPDFSDSRIEEVADSLGVTLVFEVEYRFQDVLGRPTYEVGQIVVAPDP